MTTRERLIPRMFHRRLALLLGIGCAICIGLGMQLTRLAVFQGDDRLDTALKRLDRTRVLQTTRGRILDRNGVVLAEDVHAYDIAVDYEVVSGTWQLEQAVGLAIEENRQVWGQLSIDERLQAAEPFLAEFQAQREQLFQALIGTGLISRDELDERLETIHRAVQELAEHTWSRQRRRAWLEYGIPGEDEPDPFRERAIVEQKEAHVLIHDVPIEIAYEFRRLQETLPGIRVLDSTVRVYPRLSQFVTLDRTTLPRPLRSEETLVVSVDGIGDHVLGGVRGRVYDEELNNRPFDSVDDRQGYRREDRIGSGGVERVFEDHLRGEYGVEYLHLDTDEVEIIPPIPGSDLKLTIDIHLQAEVQAIMSPQLGLARVHQWHGGWGVDGNPKPMPLAMGSPLYGAAVVVDIDTSEILAIVTTPTLAEAQGWEPSQRKLFQAHVNRAVSMAYPPGSIIKPMILAGAVGEGAHRLDQRIDCVGHFFPHRRTSYRCWIYREQSGFRTHTGKFGHTLNAQEALAGSCNIFFFTLAERLGAVGMDKWLGDFGIGTRVNSGLSNEFPGALPDLEKARASTQYNILAGIGQGDLLWTPLHAANAFATFARGGMIRDARIVANDPRADASHRTGSLNINPRVVKEALIGMGRAVNDTSYGTGAKIIYGDRVVEPIINVEGVKVWAKTGTAQAPPFPVDLNGDGERDPDSGIEGVDHAWFVGLVGETRPRYSIAVIVEHGGSGGRVAGPIANQIMHALQRHGYLE